MIAALFVDESGPYTTDPRFDAWGVTRDARTYAGPGPVVVHPPCERWSRIVRSQPQMVGGADQGCFHVGLQAVRSFGGVLEHPAESTAWKWFGLPFPPAAGWSPADCYGGRSCRVDQRRYGHDLTKPTWLYAVLPFYPRLDHRPGVGGQLVKETSSGDARRWRTPDAFKDVLHAMAASCEGWSPTRGPDQLVLQAVQLDVDKEAVA